MPLPRVRIRTLMIAVAVAAVGIEETVRLRRLSSQYRQKAAVSAQSLADHAARDNWTNRMRSKGYVSTHEHNVGGKACRAWIDYQSSLKSKYERAARYPWLPLPPDPPAPK